MTTAPLQPPAKRRGWQNTSGRKHGLVPEAIDGKWNWSAFLFPTVFAGVNRLWLWLAIGALPAFAGALGVPRSFLYLYGLALSFYLAWKGNALAWASRRWDGVDHFLRAQRRAAWLSLVALVALIVVVARTSDTDRPGTYEHHGIAFSYPAGWGVDEGGTQFVGVESLRADALWIDALFPSSGNGIILLYGRDLGSEIAGKEVEREKDLIAASLVRQGHTLAGEPQVIEVGGLPAISFDVTTPSVGTADRLFFIVSGATLIVLKCQHDASDTSTLSACDSIVQTFQVTEPAAAASPSRTPEVLLP